MHARLLARRGKTAQAEAALELASTHGSPDDVSTQSLVRQAEALLAAAAGQEDRARAAAADAVQREPSDEGPNSVDEAFLTAAEVERMLGSVAVGRAGTLLASVTAISPRDAWAAGGAGNRALIEHWDGTAWRRVPGPSPRGLPVLTGVSAASAGDVWAVGSLGEALMLHWDGTAWRRVPSPDSAAGATLEDVTAFSASDAWATGESGRGTLILHWDGTTWRRARSPAVRSGAGLHEISGTSPRNLWAAGATGDLAPVGAPRAGFAAPATGTTRPAPAAGGGPAAEPLILHRDGTAWRRASIPVPANGGMLLGVYAASGHDAWAVGSTQTYGSINAGPLVLHWTGSAWT